MVIATNLIIYCNISVQQIQHECDAQVAQFTCVIEELRAKMRDMEAENRDKVGLFVFVSWFFTKIFITCISKYEFFNIQQQQIKQKQIYIPDRIIIQYLTVE